MRSALILTILLSRIVTAALPDFMIALTRQDASMDWWYAVPQQFTPQMSLIHSVNNGEYFRIIPFFKNYGIDSNRQAHITVDMEIIRPDGSVDESVKGCIAHRGTASPPNLIACDAVLNMCFDPDDPPGNYVINVTAYDQVSNATNRQSVHLEQRPFSLETLTEKERENLFVSYATAPNPSRALSAFLQTDQSFLNEDNEPVWSAIWFFKTIFEKNDFLIPHLVDQFSTATLKQQHDIILLLALLNKNDALPRLSGNLRSFQLLMESGRIPDPYAEITRGKQLDMLWAEYFATGTVKPIRQLLTSLNLSSHVGTLEKIKSGTLDPAKEEVYRAGMLEATFQSALWSLRSNCRKSPLVYHYCVGILDSESLEKPAQACLGLLLQSMTEKETSDQNSKKEGSP